METKPNTYFDESYELIKNYMDDRFLLLKVQTAKNTARIVSSLIFIFISSILLFFMLMFVGFMLAYYFSEKLHSTFYGFSAVVAIYLGLLFFFILLFKTFLSKRIKDMVTNIFFEKESINVDEDED